MKQFIYIVTAGNQSIEVWELLNTGEMFLLQIIKTGDNEGQPIIISKKRNKLYVGTRPKYQILTYDILKNGKLNQIGCTELPYSPNYFELDRYEDTLFCSYYHAGCLSVSYINHQHIPDKPIQILSNIKGCHSVKIDLSNQLLFSPALLVNQIYVLKYNIKNKIKPLKILNCISCPEKSGPRHIICHNNKNYCYSINELNGTIDVWQIHHHKNNILNIQNISISNLIKKKQFWSAEIHMTSCGNFLYTSDRLHNIITIFQLYKNYKIKFIRQVNTIRQPKSFVISNNQHLIVASQQDNTIAVYNISINNGLLNKLYEYQTGINPTWIISHTT